MSSLIANVQGVYLPKDLDFDLNWKVFYGDFLEIAPGINLRHSPGHTPGLCIMQVNLRDSGTWIFTTDQYHVIQNYEADAPQGWLARDHDDWIRSHQMIKALQKVRVFLPLGISDGADCVVADERQSGLRPLCSSIGQIQDRSAYLYLGRVSARGEKGRTSLPPPLPIMCNATFERFNQRSIQCLLECPYSPLSPNFSSHTYILHSV